MSHRKSTVRFIDDDKNTNRYVMYPIVYDNIYKLYNQLKTSFWIAEEVDLSQDLHDWNTKLTDNEKVFIKNILSFFVSSDAVIQENLLSTFMNEVNILESRAFYSLQIANEQIHQDMYKNMLIAYINNRDELNKCFNAVYDDKFINAKTKWAEKWINNNDKFASRLVAFAVVEGVFFSSSFAAIFWLKKRGLMPGLAASNEFISRDESRHTDHAIELYKLLMNKISKEEITNIIVQGVELECMFVESCLNTKLIGMNSDLMKQYVKFCADRLLLQFDCDRYFKEENPFDFMTMISLSNKTNFFEHRTTEYNKAFNLEITSISDEF
jgi:ribonucleotide reductase beta subunit family protein with ferritin-like domain